MDEFILKSSMLHLKKVYLKKMDIKESKADLTPFLFNPMWNGMSED
jgi:hypothetical protein